MVEVAPAELPGECLAAALLARSLQQLARREAAEAKVGREAGGRVCGKVVVALPVGGDRGPHEGVHPAAALLLAARGEVGRGACRGELSQRRQRHSAGAGGRREAPRRAQRRLELDGGPGPVIGTEDPEVIATGGGQLAGRDHRGAGVQVETDPLSLAGSDQPALAAAGQAAVVGAGVDLGRAGLLGHADRLADRIAAAHEEGGAKTPQRIAEVAQRVQHEGEAVGAGEAAAEDRLVEDEQRYHSIGARRRPQRRVIVHPEVAVEEKQRNRHDLQATQPHPAHPTAGAADLMPAWR